MASIQSTINKIQKEETMKKELNFHKLTSRCLYRNANFKNIFCFKTKQKWLKNAAYMRKTFLEGVITLQICGFTIMSNFM